MKIDTKVGLAGMIQVLTASLLLTGALTMSAETAIGYRLWELFPALIASSITTFGLKEIRKRT